MRKYFAVITSISLILASNISFTQEIEQADTTIQYQTIEISEYELDDVVVTGSRINKKIIDIPYPVVRIDNSLFQYDRKVGVFDVLPSIPGCFCNRGTVTSCCCYRFQSK